MFAAKWVRARCPVTEVLGSCWCGHCCRGRKAALDVARGLAYLHANRLTHFDLKSSNVLLDRTGSAKISDVGFAQVISQSLDAGAATGGSYAPCHAGCHAHASVESELD